MTRRDFLWLLGLTGCYSKEIIRPSGIENDSSKMKKQIIDWWAGSVASSAFDDVWGWWRADDYSGSSPNIVLNDKSLNGNSMTQAGGTLTPGTAANGKAKMTGNSTARLISSLSMRGWPSTIITVGKRLNNGDVVGFLDIPVCPHHLLFIQALKRQILMSCIIQILPVIR